MAESIVFIGGESNSWEGFAAFFSARGYLTLTPEWPSTAIIRELEQPPILIGHSFRGLIAQILLGHDSARAAVAIAPATATGIERPDFDRGDRGPLLIIAGEHDHTVPPAVAKSTFDEYRDSPATTGFVEFPGRSHLLMTDEGWEEVAHYIAGWLDRVLRPAPVAPGI
jgi:pimeloyl-ACP methyl ester carboxylesterase